MSSSWRSSYTSANQDEAGQSDDRSLIPAPLNIVKRRSVGDSEPSTPPHLPGAFSSSPLATGLTNLKNSGDKSLKVQRKAVSADGNGMSKITALTIRNLQSHGKYLDGNVDKDWDGKFEDINDTLSEMRNTSSQHRKMSESAGAPPADNIFKEIITDINELSQVRARDMDQLNEQIALMSEAMSRLGHIMMESEAKKLRDILSLVEQHKSETELLRKQIAAKDHQIQLLREQLANWEKKHLSPGIDRKLGLNDRMGSKHGTSRMHHSPSGFFGKDEEEKIIIGTKNGENIYDTEWAKETVQLLTTVHTGLGRDTVGSQTSPTSTDTTALSTPTKQEGNNGTTARVAGGILMKDSPSKRSIIDAGRDGSGRVRFGPERRGSSRYSSSPSASMRGSELSTAVRIANQTIAERESKRHSVRFSGLEEEGVQGHGNPSIMRPNNPMVQLPTGYSGQERASSRQAVRDMGFYGNAVRSQSNMSITRNPSPMSASMQNAENNAKPRVAGARPMNPTRGVASNRHSMQLPPPATSNLKRSASTASKDPTSAKRNSRWGNFFSSLTSRHGPGSFADEHATYSGLSPDEANDYKTASKHYGS